MEENYGLGLFNLTSLDKQEPGVVKQKGAFTIVDASGPNPNSGLRVQQATANENILITGFTMYGIKRRWAYRFLRWLAAKLTR